MLNKRVNRFRFVNFLFFEFVKSKNTSTSNDKKLTILITFPGQISPATGVRTEKETLYSRFVINSNPFRRLLNEKYLKFQIIVIEK